MKSFGRIPALLEHDQFVKDQIAKFMENNRLSIAPRQNYSEFLEVSERPNRVHSEAKFKPLSIVENRSQPKIKGSLANILLDQRSIKPHLLTAETLN